MPPVNSIHQLVEGQWVKIGSMTRGRCWCLAVSPSPDRILIVVEWEQNSLLKNVLLSRFCIYIIPSVIV